MEKMLSGDDILKKVSYITIIRITAITLMLAALISACIGSNQSAQAFLFPIGFQGEYSFDNGETWHTLSESSDVSAKNGRVILKGGFG
ncbi:MAG: hypothetical protein ACI4SF_11985, partial [Oscillospiraceae bacterium]